MADEEGKKFANRKVSELRIFLSAREVLVSDQPKAELVRNCYVAVSLGLQPKKSVDARNTAAQYFEKNSRSSF